MRPLPLRLAALLCALASPLLGQEGVLSGLAAVEPVSAAAELRPEPRPEEERRCTAGGRVCIAQATYAEDVCRVIEEAAKAEGLDVGFFARLLWRESLFDASAVSHAGAQGIAQFMPATARLRGLKDPFNPAEAILESADYLRDLERRFGSLGMAAVAYNAGEERAARFLAGSPFLPGETRAYVAAITGHPAELWRDGPLPSADLSLEPGLPFQEACLKAVARDMPSFRPPEPELLPWGVAIAGRDSREAAEREALRVATRYDRLLAGRRIDYLFTRYPGMQQPRYFAQIGRSTRAEAEALCSQLSAAGAGCIVRRN